MFLSNLNESLNKTQKYLEKYKYIQHPITPKSQCPGSNKIYPACEEAGKYDPHQEKHQSIETDPELKDERICRNGY